jgi:hypothetical protein
MDPGPGASERQGGKTRMGTSHSVRESVSRLHWLRQRAYAGTGLAWCFHFREISVYYGRVQ